MTPVSRELAARITATGPMTMADYMAECLLHPVHGYYTTRDPLGAAGDFTTAPEISQMFGEMIGLALAQTWLDHGRPAPFALAELGPGRGTLMSDLLRAARIVPGFAEAAQIHLVEASPTLLAAQARTLEPAAPVWHDHAAELPEMPLYLVANEFFDALPIRQFQRGESHWHERMVGLQQDGLTIGLGGPVDPPELNARLADTRAGDIVEICPQAGPVMAEIASRLARHGGAALVIDYGGWHSLGDTLQAMKGHAPVNILETPGEADLTAHVDFEALAAAAQGVRHSEMIPQGVFLERLGITPRAQALAAKLSGSALEAHVKAHRRLTHPEEMGTLFKTMAFGPADAALLTGSTP